jgi:hypoxanthine phosphoribosyltransferase
MSHQIDPLITPEQIAARIAEMGAQIREAVGDGPIVAVGVLKGSFLFLADLVRQIPGDVRIEFLGVASYHGTESSGVVRITHDLQTSVDGAHLLVVEDIVDTGLTLDFLLRTLECKGPASLHVAALLDKPSRRRVDVPVHFVGFTIPDAFVVGYGLDLDQRYRNLPYVGIYRP